MRKIVVFLLVGGLFLSCATSRYRQAEQLSGQGEHQKALREYLNILHLDKSKNGTYTDLRAMIGAASAYYELKQYDRVQKMAKVILKIDPRNGGALFLAGSALEKLNKRDLALKFYKQYSRVASSDPFRTYLEARHYSIIEEEIARNLRAAIRRERNIGANEIPANTLAVLYFVNSDNNPDWEVLSKGLAEMMITDLSLVKQLVVIERVKLQKLLEELQLGQSALTDPNSVPRFGKLLQAKTLTTGAFTVAGSDLHVTSSLADVTNSLSFEADKYSGALENILSMEKDIVMGILEQLKIELPANLQAQLLRLQTSDFKAFLHFCHGLDYMDQGRFSSAIESFRLALELDPQFLMAQAKLELMIAMNDLSEGSMSRLVKSQGFRTPGGVAGGMNELTELAPITNGVEGRLERSGYQLDLGFFPKRESRRDAVEISNYGISLSREKLPEPPPPPIQ
ncbi:hypothetical protein L0128_00015 [candidate division KSB1 bacterium]|nr:hypothetical protein [candidate division KSB1 bacterium]